MVPSSAGRNRCAAPELEGTKGRYTAPFLEGSETCILVPRPTLVLYWVQTQFSSFAKRFLRWKDPFRSAFFRLNLLIF